MTLTTDVTTTGDTVTAQGRFTVRNLPTLDLEEARKPLFAVVGVADVALEQVKELSSLYAAEAKKAQERVAEVPAVVKTLPTKVEQFRTEVEGYAKKTGESATDLYAKLAVRGERLVTAIRRQPATEAAIAEGKEAVRKAEAAAIAAKKSAKAGEKAVEGAAATIG
jgi:DNA polymerase II small subunit/DNA polymerase delta subunit B